MNSSLYHADDSYFDKNDKMVKPDQKAFVKWQIGHIEVTEQFVEAFTFTLCQITHPKPLFYVLRE